MLILSISYFFQKNVESHAAYDSGGDESHYVK